jgi:hypothetical protein
MVQLHLRRGIIHITKGETDGVLPQRNVHGAFRVEDIGETTHLPNMAANAIISKNKAVLFLTQVHLKNLYIFKNLVSIRNTMKMTY